MKQVNKFIIVLWLLILGIGFSSCKKTSDSDQTTIIQTQITNNMQVGTWRITLYSASGEDKTVQFDGYSFQFAKEGDITAVSANDNVLGSWYTMDTNTGTNVLDDLIFALQFGTVNKFEDLNGAWYIGSQSATKIELNKAAGGGEGSDLVTFEQN
ncbi:MAG: hypothetical protein K1X82_12730 [Bacteroidia bacterium]|nr:hypothetical protein [Bacteroidia bacterium]